MPGPGEFLEIPGSEPAPISFWIGTLGVGIKTSKPLAQPSHFFISRRTSICPPLKFSAEVLFFWLRQSLSFFSLQITAIRKDCGAESFKLSDSSRDRSMCSTRRAFSEDAWPRLCTYHRKGVLPYSSLYPIRDGRQSFFSLTSFSHALSLFLEIRSIPTSWKRHTNRVVLFVFGTLPLQVALDNFSLFP